MEPTTTAPVTLLIVDDNAGSLELLSTALRRPELEILTAPDPEEALDLVYTRHPHIVLTDLRMPKLSGLDVLERIVSFDPSIEVILMTAHYSTETAVEAIKKGAADYWNKPVPVASIRKRIDEILVSVRRRLRAQNLQTELARSCEFFGLVGNSPRMWELFSRVERVAPHFRTVLVTGATGTGKDLIAQALHKLSPVAQGHFVVLNCSAVVETLFESELFGHVRGSFTGAASDKVGLFEHAHKGTLFLDEIGDMPMATQAKLLRAIQNQEVQRLGSLAPRKVDVRVIAATHRDLRQAVAGRTFREDLFYRLSMVEIAAPPLAERVGDLALLTRHFVARFAEMYHKPIRGITRRVEIVLGRHHWPGNVRELENVIGHAAMMVMGDTIDVVDLPPYLVEGEDRDDASAVAAAAPDTATGLLTLEDSERALLVRALEQSQGNQSQAARLLRISRDTLRYRIKKYGL
ncbi:MAG: sigma-54-dependent Fis family transcriptional regulator [Acidobacteria bacterium]|nr:sigma-54-dependent Fis family transcriptional regulator [Acidobacteriota bacterium]